MGEAVPFGGRVSGSVAEEPGELSGAGMSGGEVVSVSVDLDLGGYGAPSGPTSGVGRRWAESDLEVFPVAVAVGGSKDALGPGLGNSIG